MASSSSSPEKKSADNNNNNNKAAHHVSFAVGTSPPNQGTDDSSVGDADSSSPFLDALRHHRVQAAVMDLDHYRIHGGMAVETDYIVQVKATGTNPSDGEPEFDTFLLSKTYSAFRTLALQLKKAADAWTQHEHKQQHSSSSKQVQVQQDSKGIQALTPEAIKIAKYCELVHHLVESQRTQYFGKVNYRYVKVLAKNRTTLINNVLEATCQNYFPSRKSQGHPLIAQVASIIETFFLTDHCCADDIHNDEAKEPALVVERSTNNSNLLGKLPDAVDKIVSSVEVAGKKMEHAVMGGGKNKDHHNKEGGSQNPLGWLGLSEKNDKKESSNESSIEPTRDMTSGGGSSGGRQRRVSLVVPLTRKDRRSEQTRAHDEEELSRAQSDAKLLVDDDRNAVSFMPKTTTRLPSYSRPQPVVQSASKFGKIIESNPLAFLCICAAAIVVLNKAKLHQVTVDVDLFLLIIFTCYCLGLHTPRPMVGGFDRPPVLKGTVMEDRSGRKLLRRSMKHSMAAAAAAVSSATGSTQSSGMISMASAGHGDDDDDEDEPSLSAANMEIMGSPMSMFPVGAKIGSVTNCWGYSDFEDFQVRGATYLTDKQKVASGEYLFPVRGVDLFLTDTCPENVGANPGVFGGNMRSLPTFVVNFRLPWGVLVFYYEIPKMFVPYLQCAYDETVSPDQKTKLEKELDSMTPGERCAARFLMNDQAHKNHTFKIIPYVVNGPWVVRSVVGGKPALIGNKLPIDWKYQAAEGTGADKKCLYLEADLDIAASSAARSILSVARTYCQVLTLDLGFVIQGNTDDELPEQMLVGCRLHGIDPLTSPSFPMSPEDNPLFQTGAGSDSGGDGSDDENSGHFSAVPARE